MSDDVPSTSVVIDGHALPANNGTTDAIYDEMAGTPNGRMYTIIIVLSKYRLSLAKLSKPHNVRIYVVAPPRMLYDETNIDVYYNVQVPMGDSDFTPMLQKARELASMYSTTKVRLVAFERKLQKSIAKLRFEMDIDGFTHEQVEMLGRLREASQVTRRGGLTTPRYMTLTGSAQPELWLDAVHAQLGGYPLYVRPAKSLTDHASGIIGVTKLLNDDDTRQWIKTIYSASSLSTEWILEECYEDGTEFVAMCSIVAGLIYCISSVDHDRSWFDVISTQRHYALQLYTVDQTRDLMPGLESFIMQTTKAIFAKNYIGTVFIRGFYKSHNDIFLLGVDLQPGSECLRSLIRLPKESPGWESINIHSLFAGDSSELDYISPSSSWYHSVINVPSTEGVLIHQTTIPKRRTSGMRVSWRAAEGQELRDAESMDSNVVQIYMWNSDHSRLHEEMTDVMARLDITIDRNPVIERNTACRRNLSRLGVGRGEFVRSCTTTD